MLVSPRPATTITDHPTASRPASAPEARQAPPAGAPVPELGFAPRLAPPLIAPAPPPGTGLVTGSAMAVSAGGVAGVSALLLVYVGAGDHPVVVGLGASSLVVLGGGVAMLVLGQRRRHRYQDWLAASRIDRGKPSSHGLLVGGGVMAVGSSVLFASGAELGGDRTSYVAAAALLAAGGTMIGFGVKRKRAYSAWTRKLEGATTLRWTPTLAPTPGGAMLGAVGQF